MKALILAAGLGTRLKPFTDHTPKALFKVEGKTLLEHCLNHLKTFGIHEVILNVHHFPDQIIGFLKIHENFGMKITFSDESDELLDTGGGMKKASWFFSDGEPFLVRNVDIISDLDLEKMHLYHQCKGGIVTLAVRNRETSRYFLFDEHDRLCGWENKKSGERKITRKAEHYEPLAFSGIQIVNPSVFNFIDETGKFSLTGLYLRLSGNQTIIAYQEQGSCWRDAGTSDPGNRS